MELHSLDFTTSVPGDSTISRPSIALATPAGTKIGESKPYV